MTRSDLQKMRPIPGFRCMEMKRGIQEKIWRETRQMSLPEFVEYLRRKAAGQSAKPARVAEKPPLHGDE